jgi:molybdate transport system substrate-binding protein
LARIINAMIRLSSRKAGEAAMFSTVPRLGMIGFAAILCFAGAEANAAEIKLVASNAVKEAYGQLLPAFEKSSGNTVTVSWGGTADIMKRIAGGEIADVVIITDAGIANLTKQGKLVPAGRVNVAKSAVGAAVKEGAPKPDLSSPDALKTSLLHAKAIVLTPGPSNSYLHELFGKLGIASQMDAKEIKPAAGQQLTDPIIAGAADIVLSQASELIAVKGIAYAGALPAAVQIVLTYQAAVHASAPQPEAAKALVKFLTAPAAVQVLKKNGLEPG